MQGPDMRGDGDTGQTTPHRGSTRGILPPVPGAPVKKRNRCQSAKGSLTPKRLVYNGVSQTQEGTQDTSECLDPDSSQEMQELLETRINTVEGTWVQCDNLECNKWRYLANVIDPSELPEKWFCSMNSDPKHNTCEAEEDDLPDDDLLETKYFVGSLVWAKVNTYPWWPAMIDDDPDLGVYEWRESEHGLPTSYHVTFLDQKVTRAWVRDRFCVPFRQAHNHDGPAGNKVPGYYRKMFDTAVATAEIALKMTVAERIKSYCFLNKYRGTQNSVQAPKEKRPRGRPRKTPAPDTQPGKDATAAKPRQGVKRPRAPLCTNIQEASDEAEQPHPKQSKETTKQGKTTPRGRPRKVNASPTQPSTEVTSQVNQAVKRPRGRPRKNFSIESSKPAQSRPKKPTASSKQALELEREDMEPGDCKKASAALAAPTTRILKQPARGKLSAIQSKRRIEETIQAQTYEKGSKENVSIVTASLIPTVTTASGKTKVVAHDAGVTVSKRHAEHETQNEEAGAPSEQSLFTSSTDHKNPDSMGATAFPQPIKNPGCAFKMSAVPNPAEKKDDSAVCAGVTIDSVTESDRVKLRTDIDVTHAPIDNATAQAEPDSDKSPTRTKADDAKLLVPRRDSTEAEFVYSIPSFDSAEAQLDAMMSIL
ncbi:zinc finger CW-type PWWP domain protein 1-like [Dermacentor silvarum]|uniref:zinc finger CW-type PWWP domain protein 1-like n=1 Tax=Dermacentor silvarum TaxID=543639 RepID=UPI002101707A|nr:zinc finger CW-type PWWP domain protein 1-like [Dermacentor silvarum]